MLASYADQTCVEEEMIATDATMRGLSAAHRHHGLRSAVVGRAIVTTIEWYDFFTFGIVIDFGF